MNDSSPADRLREHATANAGSPIAADILAVLAELEQARTQREGDEQAANALILAVGRLPIPTYQSVPELHAAANALCARFDADQSS